jgi:hypothetical protein
VTTNFLWYPGYSSNNGLLQAQTTLLAGSGASSELYGLAPAGFITSSVSGTSGVFNDASGSAGTDQAIWGELFLTLGTIGSALSAGANIACWFLQSPDGGSTFDGSSGAAPSRPPDFLFILPVTTITAGWIYKAAGMVRLPALPFKVGAQNNTGQTLASAATNFIRVAPIAVQY